MNHNMLLLQGIGLALVALPSKRAEPTLHLMEVQQ
jgi:hypothetical protein